MEAMKFLLPVVLLAGCGQSAEHLELIEQHDKLTKENSEKDAKLATQAARILELEELVKSDKKLLQEALADSKQATLDLEAQTREVEKIKTKARELIANADKKTKILVQQERVNAAEKNLAEEKERIKTLEAIFGTWEPSKQERAKELDVKLKKDTAIREEALEAMRDFSPLLWDTAKEYLEGQVESGEWTMDEYLAYVTTDHKKNRRGR